MSISHAKPSKRLRFILLATLVAVGTAFATFGAAEAQAHGTCNAVPSISKNNGVIVGKSTFTCTSWHRALTATVYIERLEGGTWVPASETGEGTGFGYEARARTTTPCVESDNYRAVAGGATGDETSVSPHSSQNPGGGTLINCTTSDPTNPNGAADLAVSQIPTIGGVLG